MDSFGLCACWWGGIMSCKYGDLANYRAVVVKQHETGFAEHRG
jgi:hypothetical protein